MRFAKREEDDDNGKCNQRQRRPASDVHEVLSFKECQEAELGRNPQVPASMRHAPDTCHRSQVQVTQGSAVPHWPVDRRNAPSIKEVRHFALLRPLH